jgi:CHASE3 domain sensor protein
MSVQRTAESEIREEVMSRATDQLLEEIADMTPEQRGHLIKRVRNYDWPEARKTSVIEFIMMVGLVGEKLPKDGKIKPAN